MLELSMVLGDYPHTRPLREGRVRSDLVSLRFRDFAPVNRAFRAMASSQEFDVCELAVGAFLQMVEFGKPVRLLPFATACGVHHHSLTRLPDSRLGPADLPGKRIGIRSYSQTTGLWLRGALWEEYGIAHDDITWVTLEGSHVEEYADPPFVRRAPKRTTLPELLDNGAVDAVVGVTGQGRSATVIPDSAAAELGWFRRHGTVGINHMVAITDKLALGAPEIAMEVYRMLCESRRLAGAESVGAAAVPDLVEAGVAGVRPAVELAIDYAVRQELLSAELPIDGLFPDFVLG